MIRIVGDVHGKTMDYIKLVEDCEYSIQVGDMGFNYDDLDCLFPSRHKFLGGNHDNYDIYDDQKHALGSYGLEKFGDFEYYFIRGAFSIDKRDRIIRDHIHGTKSWWSEEQLGPCDMGSAYHDYVNKKPDFMITHSCPDVISKIIGNPSVLEMFGYKSESFSTDTQKLLQMCFDAHKPKTWVFGHFHTPVDFEYKGTRFICLPELAYIDVNGENVTNNNKVRNLGREGYTAALNQYGIQEILE